MSILNLEHVSKNLGGRVILDEASVGIEAGEKVGIIGVNGTGKSTLLSIVAKVMEPDEGEVIWQNGLRISYLLQNPVFDPKRTLLENVAAMVYGKADHWDTEGEVRANLLKFGIPDPDTDPSLLSGGQKKRAALVAAMLTPSDVLILDEPTNHLDIQSKEILEQALNHYEGTVLYVSHDRFFINQTAHRILDLEDQKLVSYLGNYDYYLEKHGDIYSDIRYKGDPAIKETSPNEASDNKLSWQEQKENQAKKRRLENALDKAEQSISDLEEKISDLENEMAKPEIATNIGKLAELSRQNEEYKKELKSLYDEWEEISVSLEDLNS
ncbi:MAG: ATP-binding cassette domain-containing protein, partial [Firmicutes bacterium]|nr:ATP-binding cassette domain-containing protein [Bacillota bacterium]